VLEWRAVSERAAVPAARQVVRASIHAAGILDPAGERSQDVQLCASELITNAVKHARGDAINLLISWGATAVRLSVIDQSNVLPAPRIADSHDAGGRGLTLLQHFGTWGAARTPGGKCVWCEIPYECEGASCK